MISRGVRCGVPRKADTDLCGEDPFTLTSDKFFCVGSPRLVSIWINKEHRGGVRRDFMLMCAAMAQL